MTIPRTFILFGLGLLLTAWLVGCSGPDEAPADPMPIPSTWSRPLALAETTATGSPALAMTDGGWALAWAEEATLRFAIVQADGTVGPAQTVVLGRAPWNLTLLPIPGGDWHLLWQDTDRLGEVRLFSALLAPDGVLSRGPLAIAPDPITAYTAAVGVDGTAAVIWIDAAPRPQLFGRAIDSAGRPTATGPQAIASGATGSTGAAHPALVAVDDSGWLLAWLQRPSSPHAPDTLWNVMLLPSDSDLPWERAAQPQMIGSVVLDGPVEYVEQLSLALDDTTGYVLETTRHAGTGQTSTALLAFDRASLNPLPGRKPLTIPSRPDEGTPELRTDFHTTALAASWAGGTSPAEAAIPALVTQWAIPADSQRSTLPLAVNGEGRLHIAYFQRGELLGLEWTELDAGAMRWPALHADAAEDLSLVWVDPAAEADRPGRLWMITTRPLDPGE